MKKVSLLVVAALLLLSAPVMAKEGVYVGAYVIPSSEVSDDSGSGYGFRAASG